MDFCLAAGLRPGDMCKRMPSQLGLASGWLARSSGDGRRGISAASRAHSQPEPAGIRNTLPRAARSAQIYEEKKMTRVFAIVALSAMTLSGAFAQEVVNASPMDKYVPPKSPLVRERLEWFRDQKLCLMMHFGLYSVLGITESWPLSTKNAFGASWDNFMVFRDDNPACPSDERYKGIAKQNDSLWCFL